MKNIIWTGTWKIRVCRKTKKYETLYWYFTEYYTFKILRRKKLLKPLTETTCHEWLEHWLIEKAYAKNKVTLSVKYILKENQKSFNLQNFKLSRFHQISRTMSWKQEAQPFHQCQDQDNRSWFWYFLLLFYFDLKITLLIICMKK